MRPVFLAAVLAPLFFSLPGPSAADDLTALSDPELLQKSREAVEARNAEATLEILTEMQRRKTGLFAAPGTPACRAVISLSEGISDWRFKGAARQAYITSAKERQLGAGACGCLFTDYPFDAFTKHLLGKAAGELTDADRATFEAYLGAHQRDVEARYRAFDATCRAS